MILNKINKIKYKTIIYYKVSWLSDKEVALYIYLVQ